jgi:alpha-tubulin suppressor-like RCC1 family protein
MVKRWVLGWGILAVLTACSESVPPTETPVVTAIDSLGANPNPVPANVAVQFSWTVLGNDLTCQLDVEGDGTTDYTVQNCASQSRVNHTFGVQGSFNAKLTVTGSDGVSRQATTPVEVVAPNTPPVPQVQATAPTTHSSAPLAVVFGWRVDDANADVTQCRFDADSDGVWEYDGLCAGQATTSGEVKASDVVQYTFNYTYPKAGKYTATLEARDPYSAASTMVQVRAPYNRNPVITTFTANPGENKLATIEFAVTDPDGDDLDCTLVVESLGSFRIPNCDTGSRKYSFKVDGSYLVTLVASDLLGGRVSNSRVVTFGGEEKIIAVPAMASSAYSTCFLAPVGKTYCWGRNGDGQLGDGTTTNSSTPHLVKTDARFKQAWGGMYHVCGITEVGEAYCWGDNAKGSVGDGTTIDSYLPLKVQTSQRFVQISAGDANSCGLTAEGEIYCWGDGQYGHLAQNDSSYANSSLPVLVQAGGIKFTQIGMGYKHMCGLADDSKVYCWGKNEYGSVGTGSIDTSYDAPQWVAQDKTFASIIVGYYLTCGMTQTKEIWCWGRDDRGALGTGAFGSNTNYAPQQAVIGYTFEKHESGGAYSEHSCGIKADGETWCWGYDRYGDLGVGTTSHQPTPQQIQTYRFSQISTSGYHTCGYTLDERLMCWGYNYYGQLGDGTTADRTLPVYVKPLP